MTQSDPSNPELDLTHYVDILLRRRWIVLAVWLPVFASAFLYAFMKRPVYEASALLDIEKERGTGVYANGSMVENSNEDYYQTQYKLLKSRTLLQTVYDKLDLSHTEDFGPPNGLQKLEHAVEIDPVLRSRLVYVRVDSHDPVLCARIANAHAGTFVEQNLANQLFISKEVLQALQISKEGDSRRMYESLPAVVNNPLIQSLKEEFAKLQSESAEMSAKLTPKHPTMVALNSDMAAVEKQIGIETDKIVQSLKTELSGELKGNNVRVVDNAVIPEKPIKPKKPLVLGFGLLAGLVLGLAGAVLVESIDQSVRSQEDIEKKLGQPFLGMVPFVPPAKQGPIFSPLLKKELSLTSESFRNLRTMIDFAAFNQGGKGIIVTSTFQEEGKSYVATNLAVAMAQLGERVLLIDGDLRRPRQHKNFESGAERGLSEFLAGGKSLDLLNELTTSSQVENLWLLPCGVRPPNPSELLNTPRVAAVWSWATKGFDRVIIDCTPMFPINDTLLWARHCPSAVYVSRYGRTRVPAAHKALARLEGGGAKVLGVVVNAARQGGLTYSSYGYYYQQYYQAYEMEDRAAKVS